MWVCGIPGQKKTNKFGTVWFRRADAVLLIALAGAAVCLLLFSAYRSRIVPQRPQLEILVGNRVYGVYDLKEDKTISIGETNICEIRDGEVRMTEADCPDQICVHSVPITEKGGSIVCLPNHIVLRVIDGDPSEREVDSIAE